MEMVYTLKLAAAGTGFIFLMSVLGAAAVFCVSESVRGDFGKSVYGFAAGVMAAASVWSLLLPAIDQVKSEGFLPCWLPAAVGVLLGMLFLAVLDAVLPELERRLPSADRDTVLLTAAITLHNIPEGIAVGLACAVAAETGSVAGAAALALGIGIQNFPEGAAISLPLHQNGCSRGKSFLSGVLSGSVEPVFGMLAVFAVSGVQLLMPWLLCFAAGAMLYVVVDELIPQAHSRAGTCGFLSGFLLMMILDVALG